METVQDLIDFLLTQNAEAKLDFVFNLTGLEIGAIEEKDPCGDIGEGVLRIELEEEA